MVKIKRQELAAEARRLNQEQLAILGGRVRAARLRRRLTQAQLGTRVGLARPTVGAIERGWGGGHTLDTWQRLAVALGNRLRIDLQRDVLEEPADIGHLPMQELILRLARSHGVEGTFELPIRPSNSRHSIDVFLRDNRRRCLIVVECVNVLADIGALARNFDWKLSKAAEAAVAIGGVDPYQVGGCVVIRATARNRALVHRFGSVFRTHWPGSSARWVRHLALGEDPPDLPGLVWCDVPATRLFAWRHA